MNLLFSGAILSYLVCTVLLARSSHRSRTSLYPDSFFQIHPDFAPGFRKVIAPITDIPCNLRTDASEQHSV